MTEYKAFRVELADKIARVVINRPEKINAMDAAFWSEIMDIFNWIDATDEVRVVVLSGAGDHFSSGIDLQMLASVGSQLGNDVGRNAEQLRRKILSLQASFNAVDNCRKPVIAAIQGYCLGGAIEGSGDSTALDDLLGDLSDGFRPSFIKMDIEGAELPALAGARRTILAAQPRLAICTYHTTAQLIDIPLFLADNFHFYDLYLRHHRGGSLWETVCYALPRERYANRGEGK